MYRIDRFFVCNGSEMAFAYCDSPVQAQSICVALKRAEWNVHFHFVGLSGDDFLNDDHTKRYSFYRPLNAIS